MAQRQRKLNWARRIVNQKDTMASFNHTVVCNNLYGKEVPSKEEWEKDKELWANKMATTHTPCSCWMCGNPRKYFGEEKHSTKKKLLRGKDE